MTDSLDREDATPIADIAAALLDCLGKLRATRQSGDFIATDCFAILRRNGTGNHTFVEGTAIDRPSWLWPHVNGFYDGQFLFVHKDISTKAKSDKYFNSFFGCPVKLNALIRNLPDGLKRDLEKREYDEYTDWFSFLFIVSRAYPQLFQDWLKLRGIDPPKGDDGAWSLDRKYQNGVDRWRLNLDALAASEAAVAGLLLVIQNYHGQAVDMPDLSVNRPIVRPAAPRPVTSTSLQTTQQTSPSEAKAPMADDANKLYNHLVNLNRWAEIRIGEIEKEDAKSLEEESGGSWHAWERLLGLSQSFGITWLRFQPTASSEQKHWGRMLAQSLERYGWHDPDSLHDIGKLKRLIRLANNLTTGNLIDNSEEEPNEGKAVGIEVGGEAPAQGSGPWIESQHKPINAADSDDRHQPEGLANDTASLDRVPPTPSVGAFGESQKVISLTNTGFKIGEAEFTLEGKPLGVLELFSRKTTRTSDEIALEVFQSNSDNGQSNESIRQAVGKLRKKLVHALKCDGNVLKCITRGGDRGSTWQLLLPSGVTIGSPRNHPAGS